MQLHEILVGLQFRVGFRHRKNIAEPHTQHALRLPQRGNILLLARSLHLRTRFDDLLQRGLLEFLVLPAHLDQLGQLVMALFQQHIDIRPRLGNGVFDVDQMVVQGDAVDQQDSDDAEKNQYEHVQLPFILNSAVELHTHRCRSE